jgi:hypothetical protein
MAEISYLRHRFPSAIIQHAVWPYLRFTLSYRDVEELLAERGLDISYETGHPEPCGGLCTSWQSCGLTQFGRPAGSPRDLFVVDFDITPGGKAFVCAWMSLFEGRARIT